MDRNTVSESGSGAKAPLSELNSLTLLILHHDLRPFLKGGDLLLVSAGHGRVAVRGAAGAAGSLDRTINRFRSCPTLTVRCLS